MDIRNIDEIEPFTTKDGSEIRELMAYRNSSIRQQSLAEARLQPGCSTTPHRHHRTEEIYYLLQGEGRVQVEQDEATVGPGDAIAILPGQLHQITNIGTVVLEFLCTCSPTYEHDDTELVEPES